MANPCITAAIDHGTTNSAIALMESEGPRVIKPNGIDSIMPSVVYINKRGRMLVGQPAYRAMLSGEVGEGTGHMRYKIRIGQDDRFAFDEAKQVKTAQELGGVVMGELLKAAYEENGQEIQTCVIAVPAKFEQNACNGTIKAAQKAGLLYSPLLQEPIAAALAYGFTAEADRANWVVFDLGGGTLDVSLVIVRNGQMKVPEEGHAGDNRLGGSKFDRELMDYVIAELSKQYSLDGFSERNPQYRSAWGRLLLEIESAKIVLSSRKDAIVEVDGELCKDDKGKSIKVEVPIYREMYEKKIAPDVEKAAHLCQQLINVNRLSPGDIDGIIMVGGPTKTPYVQQVLSERLGIKLHKDIDPMTAVAIGGAIHAIRLEIPENIKTQIAVPDIPTGDITIKIEYERRSKIPKYNIVGKIEGNVDDVSSLMVEINRTDGGWSSGRIPVSESGIFSVELMLVSSKKPEFSQFTTSVVDKAGKVLATVNEPEIWHPFPEVDKARLANSLRVALKGNTTAVLIKSGSQLPSKGDERLVTTKLLRKGSREDILKIPVLETVTHLLGAEDNHADCNVHVGSIDIGGDHERIERDLPAGSEIELTIEMDESRQITAVAYIPLLDEDFESTFTGEPFGISIKDVEKRFGEEKERLEQIRKLQSEIPQEVVAKDLAVIDKLEVIDDIEKDIQRARQDEGDACYRAWTRVLELSGAINKIWDDQTIVRLQAQLRQIKGGAKDKDMQHIAELEDSLHQQQSNHNPIELEKIERQVEELDSEVRTQPYYTLALHVAAFGGVTMPMAQYNIHLAAFNLLEELDNKGAPEILTAEDLERIKEADRKFVAASPNLSEHVSKYLNGISDRPKRDDSYGSTVTK